MTKPLSPLNNHPLFYPIIGFILLHTCMRTIHIRPGTKTYSKRRKWLLRIAECNQQDQSQVTSSRVPSNHDAIGGNATAQDPLVGRLCVFELCWKGMLWRQTVVESESSGLSSEGNECNQVIVCTNRKGISSTVKIENHVLSRSSLGYK